MASPVKISGVGIKCYLSVKYIHNLFLLSGVGRWPETLPDGGLAMNGLSWSSGYRVLYSNC